MEILPSTVSCFYLSKKVTGGDWWVERQFRRRKVYSTAKKRLSEK